MKVIEDRKIWKLTPCPTCKRILTNPGYGRNSVFCCGAYHPWGVYEWNTYEIETGRDEKGRFTGAKRTMTKIEKGGIKLIEN